MPNKTFTEHVDAAKCAQVLQLNKPEIRKIFFEHNSDKNWETYWNRFSKYLQLCIKKQGVVKHTYHYANGATSGRWYVEVRSPVPARQAATLCRGRAVLRH